MSNKDFHQRYFASLSSRICSRVIFPRRAAAPAIDLTRGDNGRERISLSDSGISKGLTSASSGDEMKVITIRPAGISGGTSMVSRRPAGISTVCVMVMGEV